MGYDRVKAQNHNLYIKQYNFNCQNDTTIPNSLKTHKQTQKNAHMGLKITNLKNTNFHKFRFWTVKIDGRALTGGRALTSILNA